MKAATSESLVVFTLDDFQFALAIGSVERAIRAVAITPLLHAPAGVCGVVNVGGAIVPVFDPRVRFGLPPRALRVSDQFIIAHTPRRTVALVVDSIVGVVPTAEAAMISSAEILAGLDAIQGVVKLGGGMAFIHDLGHFLSREDDAVLDAALSA